ncbi:unknown [Bacteroides sp. CAG:530]|nr:unknown [Bacteroides sp. CAG:530]
MLSTEHPIQINGFTLFRDLNDTRKYYYLPKSEVLLSEGGKKFDFVAYHDFNTAEGKKNPTSENENLKGGYLTLEVELKNPDDDTLKNFKEELIKNYQNEKLLQELKEKNITDPKEIDKYITNQKNLQKPIVTGEDIIITPVQFNEGEVRLIILGNDGKDDGQNAKIRVVGSHKPSLYDKENAVFSVKLGAIEAEIIHKLLKNKLTGENVSDAKNSSQLAVMYDLTYKGVEPAHNVEITVNFNAVDEYKNHKFKFDSEFNFSNKDNKTDSDQKEDGDGYNIKVIADADVDVMLRELTNNGSIIIKQTNYKDGEDSILGPNDPTGMELVKRLLSAELFTPVPIPYESYSALKKDSESTDSTSGNEKPDDGEKPDSEESESSETKSQESKAQTASTEKADLITSAKNGISKLASLFKKEDADKKSKNESIEKEKNENAKAENEEEIEKEAEKDEENKKDKDEKPDTESKEEAKEEPKEPTKVERRKASAITWNLNAKLAYAFKKQKVKDDKERTYTFDKRFAVNQIIHPCGMVMLDGIDYNKQVHLLKLGSEEFRQHEVMFQANGINFDKYHLKSIEVDVSHPDTSGIQFSLTKDNPYFTFNFYSENYGVKNAVGEKLNYTVHFVFDNSHLIGFNKTDAIFTIPNKETSEKSVSISHADFLKIVKPLQIQIAALDLNMFNSVIFSLYNKTATGEQSQRIYNEKIEEAIDHVILLNPNENYDAQVLYSFNDQIPASSRSLTITTKNVKAGEFLVNDPLYGFIKISTIDEEDSFDLIRSIDLKFKYKNNPPISLGRLTKKHPYRYLVVNNDSDPNSYVQVEDINVTLNNTADEKDININKKMIKKERIALDAAEFLLDV